MALELKSSNKWLPAVGRPRPFSHITIYPSEPARELNASSGRDNTRWNRLENANKIYVGQKLKLSGKAPLKTVTYNVRKGDNLQKIANKE